MATPKEKIYSEFYPFVDTNVDFWRGRRVIPYSRAYADAYAAYVDTRKKAEEDRARRMDLYLAVGMLAGVAACGLGPVAAMIAAAQRPARIGVVALANAVSRLGIANRGAAWALMTKFTFGGMPQIATAVWGSQGRDILKKHLNNFSGGVATTGKAAAAVRVPLRNDIQRDKMPIEFFLELDGLLLKAKNAITGCALDMIQAPGVSVEEFRQYCDITRKSNLFTKSPKMDMTGEQMTRLANEMELALWAFAASSWKQTRTVPTVNRTGAGPSTKQVTDYSNYLEEDRVLERIDKVAKNLGMTQFVTERSKKGAAVASIKGGWDEYFGVWHSSDDKDLLIKWAKTYVTYKANKTVMPLEFI
jgi:hypothetical protein